jgi:hypothetical protein
VAVVTLRDGEAVKAVPKAVLIALRCTQDALQEQAALQAACTCPDVPCVLPRLLGTSQDDRCVYFRLEAVLVRDGTSVHLGQVLRAQASRQLPPASAACIAGCLLAAVAHLHARGVAHRDVKPSNLVLGADGMPRLVDFGHALCLSSASSGAAAAAGGPARGTEPYAAPELLARAAHDGSVDCWSTGVLVHEALVGAVPCAAAAAAAGEAASGGGSGGGAETDVHAAADAAALAAVGAAAAVPLLRALLRSEPTMRLGAAAAAEHAWLREAGWAASQLESGRREPLLAAAAAAVAAAGGSWASTQEGEREGEEEAEAEAWAAAEREELLSRGEALRRKEPERWDADFAAFAGREGASESRCTHSQSTVQE